MVLLHQNITNFFQELLDDVKCQPDTKAYILSIYKKYQKADFDLSKDSVTLLLAQGRDKKDFLICQNLGDWLLFSRTVFPSHLQNASKEYYDTVARYSYYTCYNLINKQWRLYQELADDYVNISNQISQKLTIFNISQTFEDTYFLPYGS